MDYMVSTNLNILNKGNEPTFHIVRRRQVIEVNQGNTLIGNLMSDWHVSSEETLSDHKYMFQNRITGISDCDLEETDWAGYRGWIYTRPFSSHWGHFKEHTFKVGRGVGR